MEKENFHNKVESARQEHKDKMKQALALTEDMSPMDKHREIRKLSKIRFRYYKKTNKQLELEKAMATVQNVLKDVGETDK